VDGIEKQAARAYAGDRAVIVICLVLTWLVLAFVLREVLGIADEAGTRAALAVSAAAAAVFCTSALAAVLTHLRRNRESLYREDARRE
jgi:hypothetical protein